MFAFDEALLHFAVSMGHVYIVKALIARGADVNLASRGGWTSLHYAARKGRYISTLEEFREQLRVRCDVSATSERRDIQLATRDGYVEIINALIDRGANADREDENNRFHYIWLFNIAT